MRKSTVIFAISVLLTITQTSIGKSIVNKEHGVTETSSHLEHRGRRSTDDEEEKPFWANRGKRSTANENVDEDVPQTKVSGGSDSRFIYIDKSLRHETPFWGNRGRRDSDETTEDSKYVSKKETINSVIEKVLRGQNFCYNGRGLVKNQNFLPENLIVTKSRREEEEMNPFWGNRGRRFDDQMEDVPFWGNRGRRDDDGPFWGSRGKREEDRPFWGARGRREEEGWEAHDKQDDHSPFWGTRGRRDDETVSEENADKQYFNEYVPEAVQNLKTKLSNRLKRNIKHSSFWEGRGRNPALQAMFNDVSRLRNSRVSNPKQKITDYIGLKSLRQDRLYAEQPNYIIVDRSSRSISSEDDPYFISRGKKKVTSEDFSKAARDRRALIEELTMNARNDPYIVTRGKKDSTKYDKLAKIKDLICSELFSTNTKNRDKRELSDRDRSRRYILKKIALQLQSDPYFVSRGKKSSEIVAEQNKLEDLMKQMGEVCSEIAKKR